MLDEVSGRLRAVIERIEAGDHAGAAEQFVDEVALGPGNWQQLPPEIRQIMVGNAPTFLDESKDPQQFAFDPAWIAEFSRPILLTTGDRSPPFYMPMIKRLAETTDVQIHVFHGSGHIPQVTDPDLYVQVMVDFIAKHPA
jgi:pimeloyl-ACP methyl ester carboxylesterase